DLVVDGPQDAAARACARVARRADRHGTVLAGPATLVHGNMHASTRDAAIGRARDRVVAGGVVQAAARKRRADANARVAAVRDRAGVPDVANGSLELHGVRAGAGRGVARPRVVALVLGGADDGVRAGAHSPLTGVGLRACVPVVAGGAVGPSGVRAGAGGRVARPGVVTLVGHGADDGVPARAHARLAGVGLRARVAVVAGGAVGLGGVRARAGTRVARPRVVTLVGCGADDGVSARAHAALAGVGPRAGVAVVARAAVGLGGVRAHAGRRVACARVVTLVGCGAHDGVAAHAHAVSVPLGRSAGVAVVAGAAVGLGGVRARAGGRVARPRVVTLVGCGADDGVPARAHAALAGVGSRAGVVVVARASVGLDGVRARARGRVAGARVVTLVGCGADDGVPARARAAPAGVGSRAGGAVVARAPVGLDRGRARAGCRVVGPGFVTLVGRGADDGIGARAHATLAGVGVRARVAVVARAPVGLGGVRACAGGRIAGARVVALILRGADMTYLRVHAAGPRRQREEQHQEMEDAAHGGEPYLGCDGPWK